MNFEESKAYCFWLNRGKMGAATLPSTLRRDEAYQWLVSQGLSGRASARMTFAVALRDEFTGQQMFNLSLLSSDPSVVHVSPLFTVKGFGVTSEEEVWRWSERNGKLVHRDHFSRNWS